VTEIVREDKVIDMTGLGLPGRDGITGAAVSLRQTNESANAIQAGPLLPGSAMSARTVFDFVFLYETDADTISLETPLNVGDPKLITLPGGANLPGPNVRRGDRVLMAPVMVDPDDVNEGFTAFEILAPGLGSATGPQAMQAFVPNGGTEAAGLSPAALSPVLEALGVMLHRGRFIRPTKAKPYVLFRESKNRILVTTTVMDGGRMDYSVHEFINQTPLSGPTVNSCWRYNGCLGAQIDGVWEDFSNFTGEPNNSGQLDSLNPPVFEPVASIGPHASYPAGFDFNGPGHWHISGGSGAIYINGSTATNYALDENLPVGTVLRCSSYLFDFTYASLLADNATVAGTWAYTHTGVPGGVNVLAKLTITGSGIGMVALYGAMLSGRGDKLKPEGIAAIDADREDGLAYGAGGVFEANLGEANSFQLYTEGRETHIFEAALNGGGPVSVNGAPYGWSENGPNRDSWLQDRAEGYAKVYIHGVNRTSSMLIDGKTFDMNVTYRARRGALV
jgi:hypothetical protein